MRLPATEGKAEHTGVSAQARAGFFSLSARGESRACGEAAGLICAAADIP
jgi:hypothetical protein